MTEAFVDGAELMARACGMEGYRFAVIGHPISSATDAELAAKAAEVLHQAWVLLLDVAPDSGPESDVLA
jgi:hypothetical protein